MKILHTADWHIGQFKGPVVDGVNLRSQDTVKCLEYMVQVAIEEKPDIVCVSGDIFHQEQVGPVRYSDEMITATNIITSLAHFSKYVIVMRGTPNHDGAAQFRVLERMLLNIRNVDVVTEPGVIKTPWADIACLPGFDKQEFRAKFPGLSADEENLAWTKYISDMVFALRAECEKTPILMAHYTVPGCNMESGQTSFFTNFEPVIPIDNEFSRTERDTWMLYLTQWINITIDANGESLVISDEHHAGFFPEGAAIRTDQTVRPFVAQAKYMAGNGSDGKAASISGVNAAHDQSHNGMITRFKAKGTQYCGTTAQDKNHMDNLFEVAFATRNSQSIMSGCTSYYNRFYATVVENDVERIIISKSDANYLVVGSTVSIGNATALSGNNPTDDRSNAGLHAKANRVIITKIEDYDSNNSAVYVDNGGTKFSTGSTMVGSTEVKTTIVTMPWHTGACDNVLGSCGSPNSNTSGKDPYILFGVEMFLGFYEVISNVILKISNHVMTACICYDCTKLATSVTSDYVECGYSIADTQASWKYISELGYDPENPSVRHGTKVAASSSTGYADGQYTDKLDQTSDGLREWLSGGPLHGGSGAGRWFAFLGNWLGNSGWDFAARLSASGRCAKAAA